MPQFVKERVRPIPKEEARPFLERLGVPLSYVESVEIYEREKSIFFFFYNETERGVRVNFRDPHLREICEP